MLSQNNNALGIIFPNSYDNTVPELVTERAMASIPFAGRYRMVDFVLSSMANCGISNVSVVVRKNYHSLMDHLGTGREWDMARRHGGLNIVPPFAEKGVRIYSGRVEALGSILNFLENQKEKYVVMSDANLAINFDFEDLITRHVESGADVTMVGLDVTHQCLLGSDATMRWRQAASQSHDPRTDARTFLADIVDFSIAANIQADARLFSTGMPLRDPLAAAVAVDPSLVECFDLPMKVETETGDFHGTRGRTIGDPAGLIDPSAPRVHVALTVDHDRFITDFTWRIAQLAGD